MYKIPIDSTNPSVYPSVAVTRLFDPDPATNDSVRLLMASAQAATNKLLLTRLAALDAKVSANDKGGAVRDKTNKEIGTKDKKART